MRKFIEMSIYDAISVGEITLLILQIEVLILNMEKSLKPLI